MSDDVNVSGAVASTLSRLGVRQAFGVVGSGNFHVTNALRDQGVGFVAARHEGGAATMADAYARISGTVSVVTVHQGCGLTNAMTGIAEAAKSRTPMIVIAASVTERRSNFFVDQPRLAAAVGAESMTVESPEQAVSTTRAAYRLAVTERRTVLLNLPLGLQGVPVPPAVADLEPIDAAPAVQPAAADVASLRVRLETARRPVFVAGRGSRSTPARDALRRLGERTGALLATSAVAKGLFHDDPWSLDVSGGFASPLAAELISGADLVVGWGCALNMWTMRHGTLIGSDAVVVQVDLDADALGAHRAIDLGVVGDVAATADVLADNLPDPAAGYRTDDIRRRIATELRWRDVAYDDLSTADVIDPRTLSIALDDLLPTERVVGVDSGNFMGYPSMFLSVPDEAGFCFTQAFQSIGLGLATTIGAALARPDRLPVAALGDGGALMGVSELETVVRLGLPMVVIVYDDEAYGAEVHHFGPDGHDLATVQFPAVDLAELARGVGFDAVTVRRVEDLDGVRSWLESKRSRPLLVDAKVLRDRPSWWLEDAFRGH
jgi:thiamine pyrophosphate-dependent acetolactate synthase large subunit-like protein